MPKIKNPKDPYALVENFDRLPDSAVVRTKVTQILTGLSGKTLRYHPDLPRHYLSKTHYGQRVADVRRFLSRGASR